jgi:hypothetical protein
VAEPLEPTHKLRKRRGGMVYTHSLIGCVWPERWWCEGHTLAV